MHGAGAPAALAPKRRGLHGVVLSLAPVGDHEAELFPDERTYVRGSVAARRRQFATGRFLARQSLIRLGEAPSSILPGQNRAPLWPSGCCGSISHCPDLAVAVVSRRHRSIGVDVEQTGRLHCGSFRLLFTDEEQRTDLGEPRATAMFSAKESVFKAVSVLTGLRMDFREVSIDLDVTEERFSARYVGREPANGIADRVIGLVTTTGGRTLTLAAVP